jgi:hypothetical protein
MEFEGKTDYTLPANYRKKLLAARTSLLAGRFGQVLINRPKKRPKAGVAKHPGVHPSETSIK